MSDDYDWATGKSRSSTVAENSRARARARARATARLVDHYPDEFYDLLRDEYKAEGIEQTSPKFGRRTRAGSG